MNTLIKSLLVLPALIAGLGSIPVGPATAQTFTTLHGFTGGSDGANPHAGLVLAGNTLYGTTTPSLPPFQTFIGGKVFAVNTDGTGFTNLHGLGGSEGGLILSRDTMYGTTPSAGPLNSGAVFAMKTDGAGFTNLYSFTMGSTDASGNYTNSDGANLFAGLVLCGTTLYGVASAGGISGKGTVFALNIDGTEFTTLHSFSGSDGANPRAGLVLSSNLLYGTTCSGGPSGNGTVFAVNISGTGFGILHSFDYSDGSCPNGLVLSGNTLYGTAMQGGGYGNGTVFSLNTDGTGFATIHNFTAAHIYGYSQTNSDGIYPLGSLILSGDTLYGTSSGGGNWGGTVFALKTDGTGFTTLYSFTSGNCSSVLFGPPCPNSDGAGPLGGLVLSGKTLYGTTSQGGGYGYLGSGGNFVGFGTVFSLSFPPELSIIPSRENVVLSWPTNYAGFDYAGYALQSTTDLGPSAAWTTNAPAPVVVSGKYTVTNPITGRQQFYRLSQ